MILEPAEEGGYVVRCLEVPGAISQGDTREEAVEKIKDAIQGILELRMNNEKQTALRQHNRVEIVTVEMDENL